LTSPLFILVSALFAVFAVWALLYVWLMHSLLLVMLLGAFIGLGRVLFRRSL
jgi:hypothetical protein